MVELDPTQGVLIRYVSKEEYQAICDETDALMIENEELRERIDYLERQIATHAFGGWQVH